MIRDNSWAWVTSRVICEWWRTLTGKRSNEASKPPFAPPMRARAEEEDKVHRNKLKPFNAFAKAERSTIRAEHPDIAKREVDLHLAVRWRRLPDAERREYDPSYDPELVDDNEFTERWYADEMTPSQRLMTLWGLCELRLMIGLDLLGPHDVGYEAGWKEPPPSSAPPQSAPTTRGTSTGSVPIRSIAQENPPTARWIRLMFPSQWSRRPTTTGTPARGRIKTRRTTRSCPACSAAGCSTTRRRSSTSSCFATYASTAVTRGVWASASSREVTRPGTVPCVMDRRA